MSMKKPAFQHFTLDEQDDIGIFTIHRPEVLNALNPGTWKDFTTFAEYLDQSKLKVGIITGAGNKSFIAGADINSLLDMTAVDAIRGPNTELGTALQALERCSKPVIAAINGFALGGGLEVALACDIRVISDNAAVGLPEVGLGLIPGAGGTQRLSRIVGIGVAKQLILTGMNMTAEEAVIHNLAAKMVPQGELLNEAIKLAKAMAKRGPIALQVAKRLVNMSLDVDLTSALYLENLAFGVLLSTEDKREGTSAFVEKRKAGFTGR